MRLMPCALKLPAKAAISTGAGFSCIQCRRIHSALSPLSNTPAFSSAPVAAAMKPVTAATEQSAPSDSLIAGARVELLKLPSPVGARFRRDGQPSEPDLILDERLTSAAAPFLYMLSFVLIAVAGYFVYLLFHG